MDLFSGRAGVARQLVRMGAPWVLTFERNRSVNEGLLNPDLRKRIELMIMGGAFASLRQLLQPGLRKAKVARGNSHNDWIAWLVNLAETHQLLWWVENPDTSWWRATEMDEVQRL